MRETLTLVAAVIALITALVSLNTAVIARRGLAKQKGQLDKQAETLDQQQARLADQENQVKQIRSLAATTALAITIQKPRSGEMIPPVYDDMGGTFNGYIPFGYKLWVLGRDRFNYFLMYPATQIVPTEQRWSQTNVRLATPGNWELLVCISNGKASNWLQGRADAQDWSGFSELPDGLAILRTQPVTR